ncbi:MAG: histidinol-phosphate transaminase [Lachnospiraceae bacterium]|nr:histidinol-phosphate transaminase [Lachnospiraceae bacterium]
MNIEETIIPWTSITEKEPTVSMDFSVNTNPLGVPDMVIRHLPQISGQLGDYPDPDCKVLSKHLAKKYQIQPNQVYCGNGADDLLYRLIFAVKPKTALIIEPTFEEYARALRTVDCKVLHYPLDGSAGFTLNEKIFSAINDNLDMLFLCNPNNPTGSLIDRHFLIKIAEKCREHNVLLVVDECFMEFVPDWKEYSAKSLITHFNNLIIIDAFTKTFSLAGFRLGFCISGNTTLLSAMKMQGPDFHVSVPAQFAGICALTDDTYMEHTYSLLETERVWLLSQFQSLHIKAWPSAGNYLLCKGLQDNIHSRLLKKGIKVRDCSKFYGLDSTYFRIAVKTHSENEKFINALRNIVLL